MKRIIKSALLIAGATAMLASCATLAKQHKKGHSVTLDPEQKGALVFVNGEYKGKSPVVLDVKPKEKYEVTYLKKSYLSKTFNVQSKILKKWVIKDIFAGAAIGAPVTLLVDHLTGAWKGVDEKTIPKTLTHWSKVENPNDYLNQLFQIEDLYFETGSSTIKTSSYTNLDKLASILNNYNTIKLKIHGHTDKTGSVELNQKLSKARAEAVKKYLTAKGVSADRLMSEGHGSSIPVINEDNEAAYKYNRRVEFEYSL